MAAAGHVTLAEYHALAGRWAECFSHAVQAGEGVGAKDTSWAMLAAMSGVWLRDPGRVERVRSVVAAQPLQGRVIDGTLMLTDAALAALGGDRRQAAALFQSLLQMWEPIAWQQDLAQVRVAYAFLVGPDDPGAAEAARAAQEWILQSGAIGLLEVWKAGLPQPAPVPA
jgi:hypothetical protein